MNLPGMFGPVPSIPPGPLSPAHALALSRGLRAIGDGQRSTCEWPIQELDAPGLGRLIRFDHMLADCVEVSSQTTVSSRYPGYLLSYELADGTYEQATNIWIVPLNGGTLTAQRYLGMHVGFANARPVYAVLDSSGSTHNNAEYYTTTAVTWATSQTAYAIAATVIWLEVNVTADGVYLRSMTAQTANRVVFVFNVGTYPLYFTHEDATDATASRRITTQDGGTTGIPPGVGIWLRYNTTTSRWQLLEPKPQYRPPVGINPGTPQNNYDPVPGYYPNILEYTGSAPLTLTGLTPAVPGRQVYLLTGTAPVTLTNQSGSSTAALRFLNPGGADHVIPPRAIQPLFYDGGVSRWRPVIQPGFIDLPPTEVTATGANNNYDVATMPSGRYTGSGATFTGLAGGWLGRRLRFINDGTGLVTFSHASGSSTAANRFSFYTAEDLDVEPGKTVDLEYSYDTTLADYRWKLLGGTTIASYYEPVTNGVVSAPEIVFSLADVVMVEVAA